MSAMSNNSNPGPGSGTSATPTAGFSAASTTGNPDPDTIEPCAICLEPWVFPVELPCHHIFCYLCIKGSAVQATHQGQTPRCSMCRSDIPLHFLSHPTLKDSYDLHKNIPAADEYQWYYESRGGGWWQFEGRVSKDLEASYETKESKCRLLIVGQIYELDLIQMIQYRLNDRNGARRIKRDLPSSTPQKKGIAGIRLVGSVGPRISGDDAGASDASQDQGDGSSDGDAGGSILRAEASALLSATTLQAMASGNLVSDEDIAEEYNLYNVGDALFVLFDEILRVNSDDEDADDEPAVDDSEFDDVDPPRDGARAPTPTNRSADRSSSSILSNFSQASAIRVPLPTSLQRAQYHQQMARWI